MIVLEKVRLLGLAVGSAEEADDEAAWGSPWLRGVDGDAMSLEVVGGWNVRKEIATRVNPADSSTTGGTPWGMWSAQFQLTTVPCRRAIFCDDAGKYSHLLPFAQSDTVVTDDPCAC